MSLCGQHVGKNPGVRVQRLLSNTLWPPFDNTERRLAGHERHVVRDYWLRQPFQGQGTDFFERRCPFDRHGNALAKQYLSILGIGTQPSGDIADGANSGVARPLGKADLPEGRIALRDASAKAKLAPTPSPRGNQFGRRFAHRQRHPDGALRRVGARHRIVEEHHDPSPENWSSVPSNWLTSGPNAPWYSRRKSRTSSGSAVSVKAV